MKAIVYYYPNHHTSFGHIGVKFFLNEQEAARLVTGDTLTYVNRDDPRVPSSIKNYLKEARIDYRPHLYQKDGKYIIYGNKGGEWQETELTPSCEAESIFLNGLSSYTHIKITAESPLFQLATAAHTFKRTEYFFDWGGRYDLQKNLKAYGESICIELPEIDIDVAAFFSSQYYGWQPYHPHLQPYPTLKNNCAYAVLHTLHLAGYISGEIPTFDLLPSSAAARVRKIPGARVLSVEQRNNGELKFAAPQLHPEMKTSPDHSVIVQLESKQENDTIPSQVNLEYPHDLLIAIFNDRVNDPSPICMHNHFHDLLFRIGIRKLSSLQNFVAQKRLRTVVDFFDAKKIFTDTPIIKLLPATVLSICAEYHASPVRLFTGALFFLLNKLDDDSFGVRRATIRVLTIRVLLEYSRYLDFTERDGAGNNLMMAVIKDTEPQDSLFDMFIRYPISLTTRNKQGDTIFTMFIRFRTWGGERYFIQLLAKFCQQRRIHHITDLIDPNDPDKLSRLMGLRKHTHHLVPSQGLLRPIMLDHITDLFVDECQGLIVKLDDATEVTIPWKELPEDFPHDASIQGEDVSEFYYEIALGLRKRGYNYFKGAQSILTQLNLSGSGDVANDLSRAIILLVADLETPTVQIIFTVGVNESMQCSRFDVSLLGCVAIQGDFGVYNQLRTKHSFLKHAPDDLRASIIKSANAPLNQDFLDNYIRDMRERGDIQTPLFAALSFAFDLKYFRICDQILKSNPLLLTDQLASVVLQYHDQFSQEIIFHAIKILPVEKLIAPLLNTEFLNNYIAAIRELRPDDLPALLSATLGEAVRLGRIDIYNQILLACNKNIDTLRINFNSCGQTKEFRVSLLTCATIANNHKLYNELRGPNFNKKHRPDDLLLKIISITDGSPLDENFLANYVNDVNATYPELLRSSLTKALAEAAYKNNIVIFKQILTRVGPIDNSMSEAATFVLRNARQFTPEEVLAAISVAGANDLLTPAMDYNLATCFINHFSLSGTSAYWASRRATLDGILEHVRGLHLKSGRPWTAHYSGNNTRYRFTTEFLDNLENKTMRENKAALVNFIIKNLPRDKLPDILYPNLINAGPPMATPTVQDLKNKFSHLNWQVKMYKNPINSLFGKQISFEQHIKDMRRDNPEKFKEICKANTDAELITALEKHSRLFFKYFANCFGCLQTTSMKFHNAAIVH